MFTSYEGNNCILKDRCCINIGMFCITGVDLYGMDIVGLGYLPFI
jgi:hypothetical protein